MPKDSILNQPNSVYGMAYYLIQSLLSKYRVIQSWKYLSGIDKEGIW